ncbi:DUF6624 domain-containing protein [Streptomyces sp. NPDC059928]|uniref:DUF6624 domain-containing protein n=1 Tax=unclassified Streptomyces TaxID=2593676 RepID=UPI00366A2A03
MTITIERPSELATGPLPSDALGPLSQLARGIQTRRAHRDHALPKPALLGEAVTFSDRSPATHSPATGVCGQRPDIAKDLRERAEATEKQWAELLPTLRGVPAELPHELLDRSNAQVLRRIVAAHGWPGLRLAGAEGADAALRLALRITDVPFVRLLLRLLCDAAQQGDATWAQWAHLYDRACVLEGLPQAYGTQTRTHPVADAAGLGARRREVGLPPLPDSPADSAPAPRPRPYAPRSERRSS